jgi:hypothetical protein
VPMLCSSSTLRLCSRLALHCSPAALMLQELSAAAEAALKDLLSVYIPVEPVVCVPVWQPVSHAQ